MSTPLHIATDNGHHNAVSLLLRAGADVNAVNEHGSYAIHLATIKGYVTIVKELLNYGTSIDVTDAEDGIPVNGDTYYYNAPLHIAVIGKNVELVEILLQHGASVNVSNITGKTPLHLAVQCRSRPILELLLKHGADIHQKDVDAECRELSPLEHAILNNSTINNDMARTMLQHCNSKEDIHHAIYHAVRYNNMEVSKYLLNEMSIDVNHIYDEEHGYTLMHYALMHHDINMDMIELLKSKGSNMVKNLDIVLQRHAQQKKNEIDLSLSDDSYDE